MLKKILLIGFFLISLPLSVSSQPLWETLESGTTEYLRDLSFVSKDTGWIVGYNGVILKTTNGGDSFEIQTSVAASDLFSVFFINSDLGFIGGEGYILKTTNGGDDWGIVLLDFPNNYYSIYFNSDSTGWAVGGTLTPNRTMNIMKTTDGGETWTREFYDFTYSFLDVFYSEGSTWAIGTNGIQGKSVEGSSWEISFMPTQQWIYEIYFLNKSLGYACGGNINSEIVLKTTDGGNNWNILRETYQYKWLTGSHFIDDKTGWLVGYAGTVIRTSDGGNSWSEESTEASTYLKRVVMFDTTLGYCVGESGTILKRSYDPATTTDITVLTPNGGETLIQEEAFDITWNSTDVIEVFIEFSSNNGASWNIVEQNIPSTGIYEWTVPSIHTLQGRIRITSEEDSLEYDISDNSFTITEPSNIDENTEKFEFKLEQNFPNPFNPSTLINFSLDVGSDVSLEVYDALGIEVESLYEGYLPAGNYSFNFDASNLPSGIYYYQLQSGQFLETKKMVLMK